ncbi:MAG: hypothetical protein ACK4UJ_09040 [Leptonema sp. (in: bacteria)]
MILKKPTFLYQGILILQNSLVEILEVNKKENSVELYTVQYIDKEGNPIIIPNIRKDELESC